ncbi:hypothetical protein QQZ08_007759 [Neonectria magnoliae]|uniref:Major facilitator superfamily (MFS) profile domain-containing protein n=1 Tax=Neonectria magnoliae TaxID=2732573 RepID=A0ABR1HWY2_9HYPO
MLELVKPEFAHVQPVDARRVSSDSQDLKADQTRQAKNVADREHDLSLKEAIQLCPKAIGFSLLFSTAIIMEGYNLTLIGAFYGYTVFQNKFGD